MSRFFARIVATIAVLFSFASAAQASLIGDTVNISYRTPELGIAVSSASVVVDASVEASCPGLALLCVTEGGDGLIAGESIDIGALTIDFVFAALFSPDPFHGFVLESLDPGSAITGFILATDIAGLDESRIAFGADFLQLNMSGLGDGGGSVSITLLTGTQVPEPASFGLLAAGLAGLGLLRRRSGTGRPSGRPAD